MMNAMDKDLQFTMELETDFSDLRIHTLDTTLWIHQPDDSQPPRLLYDFYMKPLASKYVELEESARAWTAKCATLAQEVIRRLLHTSGHLGQSAAISNINQFSTRLLKSGYSRQQSRLIILSGIRKFERKKKQAGSRSIFRSHTVMTTDREINKIVGRQSWYHDRDSQDSPHDQPPESRQDHRWKPRWIKSASKHLTKEQVKYQPSSVIFIPRTSAGRLITALRAAEKNLQMMSSCSYRRLKLMEEAGTKLKHILVQPNPWNKQPCNRSVCTSCQGEKPQPQHCKTRSLVYKTYVHCAKILGRMSTMWVKLLEVWKNVT